jgi:hypothetical protein
MWEEVTHGIIGCAMQVHRTLGNGFLEVIYQRAMELEMAAVSRLDEIHLARALNYLKTYQKPVGLLINFGTKSLEFKRVHNHKLEV